MELDDYFNVHYIDEDESFIYDDIDLTPIKTIHYKTEDDNIYSYGLFIRDMISGKKILFTGDTMFLPEVFQDYYDISDIIIHDCETISAYKTNVHSHYDDLCLLDKCIKRKMLLIHYNDNVDNDYIKRAKYDGFKGFITSDSFGRIV